MATQSLHSRSIRAIEAQKSCLAGKNITLVRDRITLLSDVSATIKPGEITALIGPSGAGKTTLLKALSLLELPTSGELAIDSDTYSFPLRKGDLLKPAWPAVTVVFQQLFLWPHLTLRQNITLPLGRKLDQTRKEYLDHLLKRFDMQRFIDRYPNQVSIGQRQRTALVRAMVLKPNYILMDEITSSLDVEQIALILSEIKLLRDEGIGIMLITHLLQFAREAADSIIFLDGGKVIEAGGKEVLSTPSSQRVKNFLLMAELAS